MIQTAVDEGAEILLDGRNPIVEGFPDGNWVGPTVIRGTPDMTTYTYVVSSSNWTSLPEEPRFSDLYYSLPK